METVYVLVRTEPDALTEVIKKIQMIEGVVEASSVTGAYDIIVKIQRDYITDALAVVVKKIRKIDGITSTETLISIKM